MPDLNTIADDLSSLTVLEASALAKMLEERWGVSAAAPVVQGTSPVIAEEKPPEQTEFDVVMTSYGEKKIDVMKTVREVCAIGLKEAQALVTGIPATLKTGVGKDEAEKVKAAVEAAGGVVELR